MLRHACTRFEEESHYDRATARAKTLEARAVDERNHHGIDSSE